MGGITIAFTPIAGCTVTVKLAGAFYPMDSAKWSPKNNLSKTTNFSSNCYGTYIAGISEGEVSVSGPFSDEAAASIFVQGASGAIILTFGAYTVTATGLIKSIDFDGKVDAAVQISVVFQTTGSWTIAVHS